MHLYAAITAGVASSQRRPLYLCFSIVFGTSISLNLVVFVLLLVLAEVFLFQPGRFVAVDSLETLFVFLLYCYLTIAGRLFVLLLARLSLDLTLFSWRFYWLFRFVNEFSAFEG